jgi:hypothetical protein
MDLLFLYVLYGCVKSDSENSFIEITKCERHVFQGNFALSGPEMQPKYHSSMLQKYFNIPVWVTFKII